MKGRKCAEKAKRLAGLPVRFFASGPTDSFRVGWVKMKVKNSKSNKEFVNF